MTQQQMLTLPLPAGDFVVSPVHVSDRSLLLTTEQAQALRDAIDARLSEAA